MHAGVQFSYICGMKALRYGMPYSRPQSQLSQFGRRETDNFMSDLTTGTKITNKHKINYTSSV